MKSFSRFLFDRYSIVPIAEVSELFPKHQINNLLRQEAETLLAHSPSEEASEGLERFKTMDHVGYIDRSLQAGGPLVSKRYCRPDNRDARHLTTLALASHQERQTVT